MNQSDPKELITYELALLQFRPNVTSEELLNVGVVALSPITNQFEYRITERYGRLKAAYPDLDGPAFRKLSRGISAQCRRLNRELVADRLRVFGEQSLVEMANRVVTEGSSNFAWSSVRFGACSDLKNRVHEVFHEYVGRMEEKDPRDRIDNTVLWSTVAEHPRVKAVLEAIDKPTPLETDNYSHTFRGSWMNGHLQVVEPISLDYVNSKEMLEQAVKWHGIVKVLENRNDFRLTALVTNRPDGLPGEKYDQAVELLSSINLVRAVIPASEAERFGALVEQDLRTHGLEV